MSGPKLIPKKKTVARSVYLEPEKWDELTDIADFHGEVFELLGPEERKKESDVERPSRNDVIDAFLTWAINQFWEDKDGRPKSPAERAAKVKKHAELLKKTLPK